MNKLLTAIALAIAPPAVAQAATQAPAAGTTMPAGHDMHRAAQSPRPIPSFTIT